MCWKRILHLKRFNKHAQLQDVISNYPEKARFSLRHSSHQIATNNIIELRRCCSLFQMVSKRCGRMCDMSGHLCNTSSRLMILNKGTSDVMYFWEIFWPRSDKIVRASLMKVYCINFPCLINNKIGRERLISLALRNSRENIIVVKNNKLYQLVSCTKIGDIMASELLN